MSVAPRLPRTNSPTLALRGTTDTLQLAATLGLLVDAMTKRAKTDLEPLVEETETTLFVVGFIPQKITVMIPGKKRRISTMEVVDAHATQGDKAILEFPKGRFEVLGYCDGVQMALFKHDKTAGCRDTQSAQHDNLAMPLPRQKKITEFTYEPSVKVGHNYLYGYSHDYSVSDGEIHMLQCLPSKKIELTEYRK